MSKIDSLFRSKRFGLLFSAIALTAACSSGGTRLAEKKYPEGFSLRHPSSWQARVADKAYILVTASEAAKEPAFLFVYPFFLKTAAPADAWFDQALAELSAYFPKAAVEKKRQLRVRPDEWALKFRFEKNGEAFTGLALCSIFERSGILYVAASRTESFENDRDMLLAMLRSFRFGEPETAAGGSAPSNVLYVKFTDPTERAFTLDVPQGWQTQGGTTRRASVDLVHAVQTESPDKKAFIQFNDPGIPAFALPNQVLAFSGFPEGSWYSPGYGVRNLVKRYAPGLQFLEEYLQQNYKSRLDRFEIVDRKDRPDIVADFNRIFNGLQANGVQFTQNAGEVAFRFRQNGEPFVGYGMALTQLVYMPAMNGGNWNVALLLIYTSPESGADVVQAIFSHMFQSIQWNPQWLASQQQLTGDVSRIVSQTGQEISKIVTDAYWTRQGVMDNVNRRFSNYILGVMDVVDPDTGQTWKVEAGHNYYWAKPGGDVVAGTDTFTRPDIDFTPLQEMK